MALIPLMHLAPQRSCGSTGCGPDRSSGVSSMAAASSTGAREVGVDLGPGQRCVVAARPGDGDQKAQAVLAPGGVEAGPGRRQHVVQERPGETVVLDAADAVEADRRGVLGPGRQIGHGQAGRPGQVAFRPRNGARSGGL
jgi:hypothetical protein